MLATEIKELAKEIHATVINDRRQLHANPELSFQEFQTAAYIKMRLTQMGIRFEAMAVTGILAMITGDLPSSEVIALRADIDALPITEQNQLDYASVTNGIMHACGHDAHTASLLGTAFILQSLKHRFGGTVKLLFQPGEELLPGGASMMIAAGVLENPAPTAIIGQHVLPTLEAGKVGIRGGKFMASKDDLYITVHGKGGHGAQPHENIDPVLIAAHILVALQQVISRMARPTIPAVLSFGKVIADGTVNIIPEKVLMEGTFRTVDESWRLKAHEQIKKIASGIAESMGGRCDIDIITGYPVLINEENLTKAVHSYMEEYVGTEKLVELDTWMASEDFALYSQATNACFYMLGTGNSDKNTCSSLHTPTFNIDEDALNLGTGLMAFIALKQLGN